MKKIFTFITIALALLLSNIDTAKAQSFETGTGVLNLGVGLGGWSYAYSSFSPALSVSYEMGFKETGDIGVLGIGGYVGFKRTAGSQSIFGSTTEYRYTELVFAPRVTWHVTAIPVENLDVYAIAQVNLRSLNTKTTFLNEDPTRVGSFTIFPSLSAGARYYFSDNFGVFGEVGYSQSYLTAGISLKM